MKQYQRCVFLYSSHHTRVLIPRQHRIVSILRRRSLHIRPSVHEILMREDLCQLASNRPIDTLHDLEICRKEDIEIALLDLQTC